VKLQLALSFCRCCRFKVYKGAVKGKPNNTGAAVKQRFSKKEW
jgi:hypothetical protein